MRIGGRRQPGGPPVRPVFGLCSAERNTLRPVSRTVRARLDARAEEDLALLRNEGHDDSAAIRLALREAAARRRAKSALRLEAEAAAADRDDVATARRVREDMDGLTAAWRDD